MPPPPPGPFVATPSPAVLLSPETTGPRSAHALQLEIAHPADIGQIQLRVVLADHTIHTHVRTEHADLAQFLLSRQSQLETALNHSGLDLGQFRVLVDRHGSGQAGQEGTPHAQDHPDRDVRHNSEGSHQPEDVVIWPSVNDQEHGLNLVA